VIVVGKDVSAVEVTHLEGEPVAGKLAVRVLLHTDQALMMHVAMERGTATPPHCHEHESMCYVLRGRVKATIDDHEAVIGHGDACLHPQGVVHSELLPAY